MLRHFDHAESFVEVARNRIGVVSTRSDDGMSCPEPRGGPEDFGADGTCESQLRVVRVSPYRFE